MDLMRIASRVAATVTVEAAIYDNTQVTVGELVDAVLAIPFSPLWIAQHDFGWLAVSQDPSGLSDATPIANGPFGEKTWGELMSDGYVGSVGEFRQCSGPGQALDSDDFLWWLTSGDPADAAELASVLAERGLPELAARVRAFDM